MPELPKSKIAALSRPAMEEALSEAETALLLNQITGLINRRRHVAPRFVSQDGGSTGTSRVIVPGNLQPAEEVALDRAQQLEENAINSRLESLYSWRNDATVMLHDLIAKRSGIGTGSRPIASTLEPQIKRASMRLVVGMGKNALAIAKLEGSRRRWHAAAESAREAIRLRGDISREVFGDRLRPDANAHLTLAKATFMLEGNSPRLRRELRETLDLAPNSETAAYWLMRYEIMVGDFIAANDIASRAPSNSTIRRDLVPLIRSAEKTPWLSFPCNFYTYRYSLIEDDEIRRMQQALTELHNDQVAELFVQKYAVGIDVLKARADTSMHALSALLLWNQGNADMENSKYASATRNYSDCQRAILTYFSKRHPAENFSVPSEPAGVYSELVKVANRLIRYDNPLTRQIWTFFRERYQAITLDELYEHDWVRPTVAPVAFQFYVPLPQLTESNPTLAGLLRMLEQVRILLALESNPGKVEEKVDAPILALALVFVPLGLAEANRMRRNFDAALEECRKLLNRHQEKHILSEVIEKPFVKILKAQILLEKADSQYKACIPAEPPEIENGNVLYQGLKAAQTYKGVFDAFQDQGAYVERVIDGAKSLSAQTESLLQFSFHPLLAGEAGTNGIPPLLPPQERRAFQVLAKDMPIATISSSSDTLAGLDRRSGPHQHILKFSPPEGAPVVKETNPLIYALVTEAQARLMQLEAGFNYLGYRDDYVPPWRFQFLLERARYFAEHAKEAQREYLNFLSNAEREEFQELSAAQTVVLEKSNIRIETARVEQARLEVEAAKFGEELVGLKERNEQQRLDNFKAFDNYVDEITDRATVGGGLFELREMLSDVVGGGISDYLTGLGNFFFGGDLQREIQERINAAQRELEKENMALSVLEAQASATVATAQLGVAKAGLVVAGMQRAAAMLRHEFAAESLTFLRNRTLNSELWYRLAHLIRSVSETYLRYAVELSFLAEQAYEFEADKRINVIRFDYDVSEIGGLLAADFLLQDLNTLEHDLVTGQGERQQQVRYVLSLAREFPETLQALRDAGSTSFTLRLEQLERRFPGLFNIRIGSIEVLPVALLDPTRFSLEITYLGIAQVRLKAQPDTPAGQVSPSPLNTSELDIAEDPWLANLRTDWPIKIRTTGPETAVFSGLSQAERQSVFSFVSTSQRGAFEHLGAAASWRIDMSMKENQVIPGTLADILITFNLSGFYDAELRSVIDAASRSTNVLTKWFSAANGFADAFFEFNQSGRMEWMIASNMLSLESPIGALRNLGIVLVRAANAIQFSRLQSTYLAEFLVNEDGTLVVMSEIPQISFTINNELVLNAQASTSGGAVVSWDFGDQSGFQNGATQQHTYARPGTYEVLLRVVRNGRLFEYRAQIVVSRNHSVSSPLTAFPALAVDTVATDVPAGHIRVVATTQGTGGESLNMVWQLVGRSAKYGDTASFDLQPGRYALSFAAVRRLNARIYNQQRFEPNQQFSMEALRIRTNRTFDGTNETTASPNVLTTHLFSSGPISPADRWTLDFPLADNPILRCVNQSDIERIDLGEIDDALLAMEYETLPS